MTGRPTGVRTKSRTGARAIRSRASAGTLRTRGLLDAAHAERIRAGVSAEIDDAVAHAEASPLPEPTDALTDLFAHYPWRD